MTIAYDAFTAGTDNTSSLTATVSHTPVGTPRCAIVLAFFNFESGNTVSSGTYGTETITNWQYADRSTGFNGTVGIGIVGSSVPTGTQTASVTWDGGTTGNSKSTHVITVTAAADCEYNNSDVNNLDNLDPDLNTSTLTLGGTESFCCLGNFVGFGTGTVTAYTGWTSRIDQAQSIGSLQVHTYDTVGSSDVTWSVNDGAADYGMIAYAINEVAASGGLLVGRGTSGGMQELTGGLT